MKKLLLLSLAAGLLQSCVSSSSLPDPVTSNHVATEGAGFMMHGQPRKVHYSVSYTFRDLKPGAYTAQVEFENPGGSGQPIRVTKRFSYPVKSLNVESPALTRIRSGQNYNVRLVLHQGSASGPVVDTHSQQVNFGVPKAMAAQMGVATQID
ncbi:hypothetical protein OKA05_24815 [Luteolibacter arcticus]|uniref:DUF2846 domain-containing protein n=1 Tax=Luteolibacter arcticus TaxID=1581411 RepID=A0ABT3GQK3_9BACT|nr:hypothetical protein [Luteolibacter arcticus]MCW1925804.1 hypothetical protein [Luteolibacter arcticus]